MSEAPVPASEQIDLASVCAEWDYDLHRCQSSVPVRCLPGRPGSYFTTKLAIDADGAPRAYHPGNVGSYDWMANVSPADLCGIQGEGGIGPAPGFYVSATSLTDPAFPAHDTRHYVDAATIPYVVINPTAYPLQAGVAVRTGALAFVVDLETGGCSGAIFADSGHAVGEGSIALALALGLDPFSQKKPPKVRGFDGSRFFYILFAGSHVAAPWPVDDIQRQGWAAFEAWGGEAQLRVLVPGLPPLKPPAPSPGNAPLMS